MQSVTVKDIFALLNRITHDYDENVGNIFMEKLNKAITLKSSVVDEKFVKDCVSNKFINQLDNLNKNKINFICSW